MPQGLKILERSICTAFARVYLPMIELSKAWLISWTGEMKFIHNLPLIIAPIAHSPNKDIVRLDTWQEVDIQHVLKMPGQETLPVQYVFQGDDNLEEIGQVGELKVVT
ncbi:hypothetical protein BPAE_0095g00360 [Botrytis paeoniae]|uniref:Uncharacterized protein n=1 Tax=Botrytis paeoniae TaxID=278948 RepID=A0A4Z1FP44_9HELO|nr:hypothetical protein BPAE_0095g00360 [Botrytis paeoniae]